MSRGGHVKRGLHFALREAVGEIRYFDSMRGVDDRGEKQVFTQLAGDKDTADPSRPGDEETVLCGLLEEACGCEGVDKESTRFD